MHIEREKRYKVLSIDDELHTLDAIKDELRNEEYTVEITEHPEVAITKLSQGNYAVVVSDQKMPLIEGAILLKKAREVSPNTTRMMLTASSDINTTTDAINEGCVFRFLAKPWNDKELKESLKQAINQFKLIEENKLLNEKTKQQNIELIELNSKLNDLNDNLEKRVEERTKEVVDLNKELRKSVLHFIQLVDKLAQTHNIAIGSHARRVTKLSIPIAKKLGMSGNDLFEFEVAALLHDVGKVGVPSEILAKEPDKLNQEEKNAIKKHITLGEALANEIQNLSSVSKVIRHHHEYFNGKGFPDRLQGEDIPLGSRIISVVDAYDKCLSLSDTYNAENTEQAIEFLKENAETLFDPKVVNLFIEHFELEDDNEIEIGLSELREGMQLSRNLKNFEGRIIAAKGTVIKSSHIEKIENWLNKDPVIGNIYIHRNATKKQKEKNLPKLGLSSSLNRS